MVPHMFGGMLLRSTLRFVGTCIVMAYIAMAPIVMACVVMACIVMAYIVMACVVMAYHDGILWCFVGI